MDNVKYLEGLSGQLELLFDECVSGGGKADRLEYIKAATKLGELLFDIHKHSQYEDLE